MNMRTVKRLWVSGSLLACLITCGPLGAAQPQKAAPGSAEVERMKTLGGTGKGKADMGQGPMEFTFEYRLVAGGSALEDRIFAGTPKEMLTMYYDRTAN